MDTKQRRASRIYPKRLFRYYWLRLLRLRGDPFAIARGLSIGAFIGITPTIPLHTILTIFLCTLFRGHIAAAIIANWIVSNPVTIPVEYYLSWKMGTILTGQEISWAEVNSMLHELESSGFIDALTLLFQKFLGTVYCLVAGGIVLAFPIGIGCYFAAVFFYAQREKKRQKKFLQRLSEKR